jgi:hypothetical protein
MSHELSIPLGDSFVTTHDSISVLPLIAEYASYDGISSFRVPLLIDDGSSDAADCCLTMIVPEQKALFDECL